MMKSFLLSSSMLLLFTGCTTFKTIGFKKKEEKIITHNEIIPLIDSRETLLYKASIDIFRHHFSGMLLLKRLDSSASHLVMITELGLKIFDFEIKENDIKLVYCLEDVNKPKIVRMIQKDIQLILLNQLEGKNCLKYSYNKNESIIYKMKVDNKNHLCYLKGNNNVVERIVRYGTFAKEAQVDFLNYQNEIPQNIILKHARLKIKIDLMRLKHSENAE